MKMIRVLILAIYVLGVGSLALAQSDYMDGEEDRTIPPTTTTESNGLQTVPVTSGYQLLLPEGTKVTQSGSQVTIENSGEYMARHLSEIMSRLQKIENDQLELKKSLQQMSDNLAARLATMEANFLELDHDLDHQVKVLGEQVNDIKQHLSRGVQQGTSAGLSAASSPTVASNTAKPAVVSGPAAATPASSVPVAPGLGLKSSQENKN